LEPSDTGNSQPKNDVINQHCKLSVIIPCYNEELTLERCVSRVQSITNDWLSVEIIIVDDCSTDSSLQIARKLANKHDSLEVLAQKRNMGKGAALRAGFARATGDIVTIQDADLEYNPADYLRLVRPIMEGKADVVYGSRYRKDEPRRVLYYWHSCMNRLLTHFSNMFTDLDLTDMETCYKLFRRDVIQSLDLKENRFGFEPEVTVKIAQARLKIYEMGVSYQPRTYEEGKKIGWKDGIRAIYCIMHYGGPKAPLPLQALIYLIIGGAAAVFNIMVFMLLHNMGIQVPLSAAIAYFLAAGVNYFLCIAILFRHKARFSLPGELSAYLLIILFSGITDIALTSLLVIQAGMNPLWAKIIATISVFIINFLGRKYYVFKELPPGPWKT